MNCVEHDLHRYSSDCEPNLNLRKRVFQNLRFLKNTQEQIISKLNSKSYDYFLINYVHNYRPINYFWFRSYAHVHVNNFHATKTKDTKAYCLVANQKREFCE